MHFSQDVRNALEAIDDGKHHLALALDAAIKDFYSRNPTGGVLHIMLDDGNLKGADLGFCMSRAVIEPSGPDRTLAIAIISGLSEFTQTSRESAYLHRWSFTAAVECNVRRCNGLECVSLKSPGRSTGTVP